jgi:hypothetical protein
MWIVSAERTRERDLARSRVELLRIETGIAAAALDARRGEYESARQYASQFFTKLTGLLERSESGLTADQHQALRPLLGTRDELITLLARSDPASAERLSDAYVVTRETLSVD